MRKIISYILTLLIVANIFAPVSLNLNKNNFSIKKNVVFAIDELTNTATKDSITINGTIEGESDVQNYKLEISDESLTSISSIFLKDVIPHTFTGLTSGTTYTITLTTIYTTPSKVPKILTHSATTLDESGNRDTGTNITLTTTDKSNTDLSNYEAVYDPPEYKCGVSWVTGGTLAGCVYQLSYLVFRLTSWLFAAAGLFFDFTFHYSIQDESYRMPFVNEGWALMRDFVNLFFIFVLLYAAISIIFNLNHGQGKKMIISVIIVGLLINFSLFATRVIIDASNILARVFYNQMVIEDASSGDVYDSRSGVGYTNPITTFGTVKSLSAGLVNKVNPHVLITQADQVNISNVSGDSSKAMGVGSAILVTLLAIGINIIGLMVFFSVGLIFLARVIGLALAMILAPLAFFSLTVPNLRNIKTIGMNKWLPDTLSMAFLAPVFVFFLYLIVQFVQTGLGLGDVTSTKGVGKVLLIVIPFAFIMVLLKKAASIAKDMSGEMGQSVTSGIKVLGGVALGGAALGTAVLGRRMIGQTIAKASRGDTASQQYMDLTKRANMSWGRKAMGFVGSGFGTGYGLNKAYGKDQGKTYEVGGQTRKMGVSTGLGGLLNKKQIDVWKVDHARHELDTAKEGAGFKDIDLKKLSTVEMNVVKNEFTKTKKSEIESKFRANGDGVSGSPLEHGEDAYKQNNRKRVENDYRNTNGITSSTPLTPAQGKDVENLLNKELNVALKASVEAKLNENFDHLVQEAFTKVNPASRLVSRSNTGSYDLRNLSKSNVDKREGLLSKVPVALIAGIATGVRMGLKHGPGFEYGQGQKNTNFMNELKYTIGEALKGAKISTSVINEIKTPSGHGGGDRGGGGHH